MSGNAIGVIGADGSTPIYQPDARWTMWSIHDIYMGNLGKNKFIPKVNDWVIEPETGDMFIVAELDFMTYIPELVPVKIHKQKSVDEITSPTNDNYRIYYDKSVTPYTLAVDGLMRINGTTSSFARVYRGTIIDPTKIISRRYDNSGNFIGHDIPLEMVAFNSHDNYAIKSIPSCNCDIELPDGEVCIVVVYNTSGKVISKATCILEETTHVAQAYAEQKYITQIFLKSAFIDTTNSTDILYPVNLPTASFNPIGVVQYNDGTQVEYPIDGNKFNLYGLDQFVSTIIGHKVPMVLSYRLDDTESALASVDSDGVYITRPYDLKVSHPNRSYNVKLFVYPVWQDPVNGYTYRAYMMSLDRNFVMDVTAFVGISSNSPSFNPLAYGVTQRITFTIDLANASSIYNHFLHVQTIDVTLRGPASDSSITNIWEVGSQVPSNTPYYGTNLIARLNQLGTGFTISSGITTKEEFLTKVYKTTLPLRNPLTELEEPIPTHIEVKYLDEVKRVTISEFDKVFSFTNPIQPHSNIEIVFLKETISGYLKLSLAVMTVR